MYYLKTLTLQRILLYLAIVSFAYLYFAFAGHNVIAGFEDDSVSYLILAQSMSPWFDHTSVIAAASQHEKYPPLFPLFLALSSGSHNPLIAHLLVIAFHLLALVLTYFLSMKILKDEWLALATTLCFGLSPSMWLNLHGILSEGQYLCCSLGLLMVMKRTGSVDEINGFPQMLLITGLLTALIMTRYIGIAAIAAFITWYWFQQRSINAIFRPKILLSVFVPLGAALAWSFLRPTVGEDLYFDDVIQSVGAFNIFPQLEAIYQFWIRATILYWSDANTTQYILALTFGILSLTGLIRRIKDNGFDGWYALYYLLILSVWPYSGQFGRFLHALLPISIIHALVGAKWLVSVILKRRQKYFIRGLTLIFLASLTPTLAFFESRASYQTPVKGMNFTHVSIFYATVEQNLAEFRALRNEQLRLDLEKVAKTTPSNAIIMWYTPNYLRLFADRNAVELPDNLGDSALADAVYQSGATHVFLSNLNPRKTKETIDGLAIRSNFEPFTTLQWESFFPDSNHVAAALLQVDDRKLKVAASKDLKWKQNN